MALVALLASNKMSSFTIDNSPTLYTVGITKHKIPWSQISANMAPTQDTLANFLKSANLPQVAARKWSVMSGNATKDTLDFEVTHFINFDEYTQIKQIIGNNNDVNGVRVHEIGAGKCAKSIYKGGYEGLGTAWQKFFNDIYHQGLKLDHKRATFTCWENYIVGKDETSNPNEMETELNAILE